MSDGPEKLTIDFQQNEAVTKPGVFVKGHIENHPWIPQRLLFAAFHRFSTIIREDSILQKKARRKIDEKLNFL